MSWKTSNLVTELVGRTLFAAFYATVLYPWVYYFYDGLTGYPVGEGYIWCLILTVLAGSGIFILAQRTNARVSGRVLVFVAFLAVDALLSWLFGLPLVQVNKFFLPPYYVGLFLTGIFLIIGFQYENVVVGNSDFISNLGGWSVVMVFSLILKDAWRLPVSTGQVFYFFASGVSLAMYLKFLEASDTSRTNRRTLLIVTLAVVGFIALFAVLLTYGFTEETIALVLAPVIWVGNLLIKVVYWIAYGVMWVLSPVLEWIIIWLNSLMNRPVENKNLQQMLGNADNDLKWLKQGYMSNEAQWIYRIIILVMAAMLVYYLIKRIRRFTTKELGYEEERESIFTSEDMKKDFLNLFRAVSDRFRRRQFNRSTVYDGTSYVLRIREIYYRFLLQLDPHVPFEKHCTPAEYFQQVQGVVPGEAAGTLTKIYQLARYGERVDEADLAQMEDSFENISSSQDNIK